MFVNVISTKVKFPEKATKLAGSGRCWSDSSQFHNDLIAVIEIVELLGVITNLDLCAPTNFAGEWRDLSQNGFEKGSLARAIWTDNAEAFPAPQNERNVAIKNFFSIT